jgi:hypothetical protein
MGKRALQRALKLPEERHAIARKEFTSPQIRGRRSGIAYRLDPDHVAANCFGASDPDDGLRQQRDARAIGWFWRARAQR